jgi:ATP-dependent exoDNAse (exonuclease V) beta subunit
VLRYRGLPHEVRKGAGTFHPLADSIKILTMHVSKGLEFPVVALCGAGKMPEGDQDQAEEARLFYVAATRATQRLIIPLSGDGAFATRLLAEAVE